MVESVRVFGASDDLIEVEGAITEEFGACGCSAEEPRFVAFSDGTVLRLVYGNDGCWEIRRVAEGAADFMHLPHDGDKTSYSDRATLSGDLRWVVCGKGFRTTEVKAQGAEGEVGNA